MKLRSLLRRPFALVLALAAIPFAVVPLAAAPLGAQEAGPPLPAWLAGAWLMESGAAWADEHWSAPRGGMMMGAGRTGFGPDLSQWESTRIVRKPDGRLAFIAQPSGGKASEFPLVTMSDAAIEFANPAHDFPQRIRYERVGQLLIAEISRMDGSDATRWQYRLVGD